MRLYRARALTTPDIIDVRRARSPRKALSPAVGKVTRCGSKHAELTLPHYISGKAMKGDMMQQITPIEMQYL